VSSVQNRTCTRCKETRKVDESVDETHGFKGKVNRLYTYCVMIMGDSDIVAGK